MSYVSSWGFLTNHAHVLLCVARDPNMRLRDIAECVGITERATHRIVCELEEGGYLTRDREGARNHYEIHTDLPLRHDLNKGIQVGDLLAVLDSKNAKAMRGSS
jgi:hypothetical protein